MRMYRVALALSGLLLSVAACGTEDPLSREPDHAPDIEFVASALGDLDYQEAGSPEDLIDMRDSYDSPRLSVIVTGAVESISQGRVIYGGESDMEGTGAEAAFQNIVVEVMVDETLRAGEASEIHDNRVYFELWQGGAKEAEDGSVGPRFTLEDWREAVPVGTRMMLFLLETYDGKGDMPTEHERRGIPDGATLLQPDPQGLIFGYNGELVSSAEVPDLNVHPAWKVDSIADISGRVKAHLEKTG